MNRTIRGVTSFLVWHQFPEIGSSASAQYDNPFAIPRTQSTDKVSVKLPTDDWMCRKMEKLNITLTEYNSTHGSDTSGLTRDRLIRVPNAEKWYDMYAENDFFWSKVHYYTNKLARLNSSFPRIARQSLPPLPIPQNTLRRWVIAVGQGRVLHVKPGSRL